MKLALSLALVASSLFAAAPADATTMESVDTGAPNHIGKSVEEEPASEEILAYWTKERMQQAVANSPQSYSAGPSTTSASPASESESTIMSQDRNIAVGAVFYRDPYGNDQACTGSVIETDGKNIILTAGSCVHRGSGGDPKSGWSNYMSFAPGYINGAAPFGIWRVNYKETFEDWVLYSKALYNQALLKLDPLSGRNVQDVVKGHKLREVNQGTQYNVLAYEYEKVDSAPMGDPWYCANVSSFGGSGTDQATLHCRFPKPTPGGPWILAADQDGYGEIYAVSSSFKVDRDAYLPEAYPNSKYIKSVLLEDIVKH